MGNPLQHEGEHIWLRQSVTLTIEGQARTIEMAVPVRLGATADEVEALLNEADAGMQRLSHHLDGQIASLTGTPILDALNDTPAPATPRMVKEAATLSELVETPIESHENHKEPAPGTAPASPSVTRREPTPTRSSTPAADNAPPAIKALSPSPAPASTPPTPKAPAPPAIAATPLSVKDFIAAAQTELSLTPKQAMDQLNVKSLSGLNLREALEALRRQSLRTGEQPAPSEPREPVEQPVQEARPPTHAPVRGSAAPQTPFAFEEEDSEFDLRFSEGGDALEDEFAEEESATSAPTYHAAYAESSEDDPFDLEDVPDFGLPPMPAAAQRSTQHPQPVTQRPAPSASPPASIAQTTGGEQRSRALQIIGQMRGTASGGSATSQQRTAYRNIIMRELGEPEAKALVQGLWRTPTERLGAEQLDMLLSWGKRDTFAEDAALVLAALRAERTRAAQSTAASATADDQAETTNPLSARTARPPARSRQSARPAGSAEGEE